jgi:hypothetical protein
LPPSFCSAPFAEIETKCPLAFDHYAGHACRAANPPGPCPRIACAQPNL